jgi:hypothetical protein
MFEEIYKYHGLLMNIISDRDVLFTSTFWKRLHQLIGTNLQMSSAYHPQTDLIVLLLKCYASVFNQTRKIGCQNYWLSNLWSIWHNQQALASLHSSWIMAEHQGHFFGTLLQQPSLLVFGILATKKLALMSAHDSIIAARIKQTRDANRKRQPTSFQQGNLVYLSTQNITFQKGLAQKLILKYMGLYKILWDYGNLLFKIDLPAEFKKRGIHSVSHSSLLRIHVPNDDRLFPGRQKTQLENGPKVEEEWAVKEILFHHGMQGDTIFEIKWKTGDITWLLSHEVSHIQAFKNYLDAQGVEQINQLPPGKRNPLSDNSQIIINLIEFKPNNTRLQPKKLLKYPPKLPLSPQPNPLNYTKDHYDNHLNTHIDTVTLMGKQQRSLLTITHPWFPKQGCHLIAIQNHLIDHHLIHMSHLFQCV